MPAVPSDPLSADVPTSEPATPAERPRARWALWILALGVLLYVPNFWVGELDKEEGRRAIPARELVASGEWVVPTIWQRPYLNKPPLYPWSVALASQVTGGVNAAAVRLPSVLATILTALGLWWFARSRGQPRAGGMAGLAFLVSCAAFEKGAFGELEAALSLAVFATLALLATSLRRGGWSTIAAGLCLGAALLIKGPPVLVFLGAGLVGLAWSERRLAVLYAPRVLIPILIGVLVASGWAALLVLEVTPEVALAKLRDEVSRPGAPTLWSFLLDRGRIVLGIAGGFLPSSLVLALAWRGGRRWLDDPTMRLALGVLGGSLVFFLVYSGTRTRYLYPALPWCCLAGGIVLDAVVQGLAPAVLARLRLVAVALFTLLGAAWLTTVAACFVPVAGFGIGDAVGFVLVLAGGAAVFAGIHALRARPASPAFLLAIVGCLICVRLMQMTQIVPRIADRHGLVARATELERLLPPNVPGVRLHVFAEWNALFYVDRQLSWIDDPARAEPGEVLVVDERIAESRPELVTRWNVLGRAPLEHQTVLAARVR